MERYCCSENIVHDCILNHTHLKYDADFDCEPATLCDMVYQPSNLNLDCSFEEYFSTFRLYRAKNMCVEGMCDRVRVFDLASNIDCRNWIKKSFPVIFKSARIYGGYDTALTVPRAWEVRVQLWKSVFVCYGYGTIRVLWCMLNAIRRKNKLLKTSLARDALKDKFKDDLPVGQCCESCYSYMDSIEFNDVVDVSEYILTFTAKYGGDYLVLPDEVDQVIANQAHYPFDKYTLNYDFMCSFISSSPAKTRDLIFHMLMQSERETRCVIMRAMVYCGKCVTLGNLDFYFGRLKQRLSGYQIEVPEDTRVPSCFTELSPTQYISAG
jgi:hypothetical protein